MLGRRSRGARKVWSVIHGQNIPQKSFQVNSPASESVHYSLKRGSFVQPPEPSKPACIGYISEHRNRTNEFLRVFPGYSEVRQARKSGIAQDEKETQRAKRGKITTYSKGSRLRFMKRLGRTRHVPNLWQDHTFADDVMKGKTIKERQEYAEATKKRYVRMLRYKGFDFFMIWRIHLEPRKSGDLKGEMVPHYHCFYLVYGLSSSEILAHAWLQAEVWVRATKTKMVAEAKSVALHPKSYRKIDSRRDAYRYASSYKYVSRDNAVEMKEGIGRAWGVHGSCPDADVVIISLSYGESVGFRRICRMRLRKSSKATLQRARAKGYRVKSTNKNMRIRTASHGLPFFIFLDERFVNTFLEGIRFEESANFFQEKMVKKSMVKEV
jgi:hypothetical protein